MSRSDYSEYMDDTWQYIMWRGQVASAIRGKRGQQFFRDLISSLDAMPDKRLIRNELRKDGEVCALGSLGAQRGINLEEIDPEDYDTVASKFNVAHQLAREVMWQNDETYSYCTPEQRWERMRNWAVENLNEKSE